jgi:hypothetical protein
LGGTWQDTISLCPESLPVDWCTVCGLVAIVLAKPSG